MLNVTVLDTAGVALPLVVISKVRVPEDDGAVAVKSRFTVSPPLILQPVPSATVNPAPELVTLAGAGSRHVPAESFICTFDVVTTTELPLVESRTVIVPDVANSTVATKLSWKLVEVPTVAMVGATTRLFTEGVGAPML
jgi:hypothetical protein